MKQVQISALVSSETRDLLDRQARARGMKKGAVIESALLLYLKTLQELPAEIILPPRLVLTRESGDRILRLVQEPGQPTPEMEALFGNSDD